MKQNVSQYSELIEDRGNAVEVTATHACNEHLKLLHSLTAEYPLRIWPLRRILRPISGIFLDTSVTLRHLESPMAPTFSPWWRGTWSIDALHPGEHHGQVEKLS